MNYSTLSVKELTEIFSQPDFNKNLLQCILDSDNKSVTYPDLPKILYMNDKLDCLEIYFNYLLNQDKDYLIIHFFSNTENISEKTLTFAKHFVDNLIAIFTDKFDITQALDLAKKFPEQIKEQSLLKLIKIYETEQSHFFNLPSFDSLEYSILNAFDKYADKKQLFSSIISVIPVIPLLIKLANNTYEKNSLIFLDNYFKSECPSYMENYVEKMLLHRTLNEKFSEKNKRNNCKI